MVAKRSANELSEARGVGGTFIYQGQGPYLTEGASMFHTKSVHVNTHLASRNVWMPALLCIHIDVPANTDTPLSALAGDNPGGHGAGTSSVLTRQFRKNKTKHASGRYCMDGPEGHSEACIQT
jgi:hypothetical protein